VIHLAAQQQPRASVAHKRAETVAHKIQRHSDTVIRRSTVLRWRTVIHLGSVGLKFFEQFFVFGVRPDPKPSYHVALSNSNCAIIQSDSDGIDRLGIMDSLELQAGVIRVLAKQAVRCTCAALHNIGQFRVGGVESRTALGFHRSEGIRIEVFKQAGIQITQRLICHFRQQIL